jgi:hypothetical protein
MGYGSPLSRTPKLVGESREKLGREPSRRRARQPTNGIKPSHGLGVYFKMNPRFWMNLQTEFDSRVAARELTGKLASRIRAYEPETS